MTRPASARPPESVQLEPASFRDPDSRVFYAEGAVYRALTERGAAQWEAVAATKAYRRLLEEGKVVGTERVDDGLPTGVLEDASAVLRHELVPFVSYPYEWTFGMLKDAALLQLEVLREGLAEDVVLKDATPYNVQWRGARPVFVDVGSFEPLELGEPWVGYRQFCMLFLYPLVLQAYKGVPFQPWLRGAIDGIAPQELRGVMSFRDLFRRGVLTHVVLHSRLEQRHSDSERDVRSELKKAGFKKELILANVRRLEKLIRRLEPRGGSSSGWTDYGATTSYNEADAAQKVEFVEAAAGSRRRRLVWDIGANDGRFSRIAAAHADYVVAIDADAAVSDGLYHALKAEGSTTILPLTVDVVDPSPGLGWLGRERTPLAERGAPELALCLALVHHVAITGNVPIPSFLGWLRTLGTELVIEFPTVEDPMVQRLVSARRGRVHGYDRPSFERALGELFEVEASLELAGATRVLYRARPKE